MVKRCSSVLGKGWLFLAVLFFIANANANVNFNANPYANINANPTLGSVGSNDAETIAEDFESVTIVDATGQVPANSWTPGVGLSNGWRIIDGYIYANENGDYGLIHSEGSGYGESDYYLTSASTSSNSAYVFIPARLSGEVQLWGRSNLDARSSKKSWLKVYEATAEGGVVTSNMLYSASPEKGNRTWQSHSFTIEGEGKYIAINLVYTDIDSFNANIYANPGDDPLTASLTLSTDTLDFGTLSTEGTLELSVTSNVSTSVTYAITGADRGAFEVTDAPESLPAGVEKTVRVKMSASETGEYQATLKITAGELTEKVTLKGTWEENGQGTEPEEPTADWKGEDFSNVNPNDNPNIPEGWTVAEGASWSIDDWWIDSAPGLKGSSGFISTPLFTIGKGQTLEFYFQKGLSYGWNSKCTVYYANVNANLSAIPTLGSVGSYANPKLGSVGSYEWTEVMSFDSYTEDGVKSITFPSEGKYYLGLEVNTTTYFDDFKIVGGATFGFCDIPAIMAAIASGDNSNTYDVNGDGKTDIGDVIFILIMDN